jgi:hypothetical protein
LTVARSLARAVTQPAKANEKGRIAIRKGGCGQGAVPVMPGIVVSVPSESFYSRSFAVDRLGSILSTGDPLNAGPTA